MVIIKNVMLEQLIYVSYEFSTEQYSELGDRLATLEVSDVSSRCTGR